MGIRTRFGPWAVVTGASSGIGRAVARRLAREGVDLVLASRSPQPLDEDGGGPAPRPGRDQRLVAVDLSTPEGTRELLEATADLDIGLLVSNAGDGRPRDFLDHDVAELRRQLHLHAITHLELVHHLGRRMAARGRGGILLTSATGGLHGMPHMANLAAAKGYVFHLGEALHHELAPHGVHVTVLLPGNVDTPLVDRIGLRRLGFPLPLLRPDTAADQALRALVANTPTLIPGRTLRLALRALPRRASVRLNGALLGRAMSSAPAPRSAPCRSAP